MGPRRRTPFAVVGVGASAGGLEAYTELLRALPSRTGMAFVLIQHLDPTHASMLPDLLARGTRMTVAVATDTLPIEPDHVYLIPPNANLTIEGDTLRLLPRPGGGHHVPIDLFFRSLASHRPDAAIGVVLSGTGSDGTQGLRAIKAAGGITFAQAPASAKYDGMPRSAIAAGVVDHVLPPKEIAGRLVHLARHPYLRPAAGASHQAASPDDPFQAILQQLLTATGVDFNRYKPSTIQRRIARRLAVHQMEALQDYARYVKGHVEEVNALYDDLLIHVTGFFRDPDAFEALSRTVWPQTLKRKRAGDVIRMWVPGCSTGEEAYSLAMSVVEFLEQAGREVPVKIFGTDLSVAAINRARTGLYPEGIHQQVSGKRLARFFVPANGGYSISKRIRDLCVFVRHDLAGDPPFARLDLVSCRNVLIYLGPELQERVVATFHYALDPEGYLLLGASETIGTASTLFRLKDKAHKLYAKQPGPTPLRPHFAIGGVTALEGAATRAVTVPGGSDVQRQADQILLSRYGPPGVVVNARMEILQFRGRTGLYLEPPPGKAELNLLKMAREGLVSPLRVALHTAKRTDAPARSEGVQILTDGERRCIAIEVVPIRPAGSAANDQCFLVVFEEAPRPAAATPEAPKAHGARERGADHRTRPQREVARLREELASTKDYLQSLIDEYEASNEELTSANEEVLSANEELQSTNEELETAKEELQSANEELHTLNEELQSRAQDLGQLNSDLTNLLGSIDIAIAMLGGDRRIRQFTRPAERLLNLLPSDVGRPISDLRASIDVPDLNALIAEVCDTAAVKEREVRDRAGRWYRMQIRPYRTGDNTIDGCVLVLVDVTDQKRAETALRFLDAASQRLAASLDYKTTLARVAQLAVPDLADWCLVDLVEADGSLKRVAEAYRDSASAARARELLRLYPLLLDSPPGVAEVVRTGRSEIVAEVPDSALVAVARDADHLRLLRETYPRSYMCMALVAREHTLGAMTFAAASGRDYGPADVALAEDLARRVALAVDNARLYEEAQEAIRIRNDFLAHAAHELRTPLTVIKGYLAIAARRLASKEPEATALMSTAIRHVDLMTRLLTELLDASRLAAGALPIKGEALELAAVVGEALAQAAPLAQEKGVALVNALEGRLPLVGDGLRLEQVVLNLLTNAIRYTPTGGTVRVEGEATGGGVVLRVCDTGVGLAQEHLGRVFEPFFQVGRAPGRRKAAERGAGLGLAIVARLVEAHGGRVWAESQGPGRGSTFVVQLPAVAARGQAA